MNQYVILLRGINVGGKNKVSMAELKVCLEMLGCRDVHTYIASGNVIVKSDKSTSDLKQAIEKALPASFNLDSDLIQVLLLTHAQLKSVIVNKPKGFGDQSETYHSDVIFLIDYDVDEAMKNFSPREGVDKIWPGKGVIYSQRLSSELTKSRLNKIIGTPAYKAMTIRSWNTTTKLFALLDN